MIGKTLSHYRIASELSRGGMGVVYRALDEKLGREVALKVRPPELVSDPDRRSRFLQEARAAAAFLAVAVAVLVSLRSTPGTDVAPSGNRSVAVLYFENNSGDPSLDWLRTALTDMLVTDLSQSPGSSRCTRSRRLIWRS